MFKWLFKKKGCAKHMNNKLEVIGIDHGWSMMKTISQVFVTGVKEITTTPALFGDVLEYEGKFYKVGTVRQEVKDTKVEDDSFYLLTLAAVAKELKRRGLAEAKVFLAVGLPLTRFGAEKNDFIKYLTKNKRVSFKYENEPYYIEIDDVAVFPQCYAAVVDKIPTMAKKTLIVDIGSWTIDIMPVINKSPDESKCVTIPKGLITCIDNPEFAITIGKATYTERVDGGTMMLEAISKCKTGETTAIGKFHGFELLVEKNFLGINYMVLRGKTEYKAELSTSPVGSMVKLENLFNGLHENIDFLEKKIEQYQNDLEASKAEYDKPFAYSKELEEKLSRQCELNAQLDLENAKAVDADLSGPEEEREADDRMESAAIVAEDKGAYPADREGRTR